ncbi:hypothetical protein EVAR_56026_1 [Eumeta japonica]|uniref:Uncharacterized protein n=1 Tax=Eumeta variegata TaxID=151549 RepID=A0A4C1YMB3_EUMVA|nr:hypothetical protein EVAR_56026_1 [Eumeta japonica]
MLERVMGTEKEVGRRRWCVRAPKVKDENVEQLKDSLGNFKWYETANQKVKKGIPFKLLFECTIVVHILDSNSVLSFGIPTAHLCVAE